LWDLSLVDPDNRRPVDYKQRQGILSDLKAALANVPREELVRELLRRPENGQVKMFVVHVALQARREFRALFEHGSYTPVSASGSRRNHVFAFQLTLQNQSLLIVVPRLICTVTGGNPVAPLGQDLWNGTALELPNTSTGAAWRNLFTGERVNTLAQEGRGALALEKLFATFPVALLHKSDGGGSK
jgi:(1->4)-alpha-D-glucan 1-alpha-D-glucosylmutase